MPIIQTNVWICEREGCGFIESTTAYTESWGDPVVEPPSDGWTVLKNDLLCPQCAKAAAEKVKITLDAAEVRIAGNA